MMRAVKVCDGWVMSEVNIPYKIYRNMGVFKTKRECEQAIQQRWISF